MSSFKPWFWVKYWVHRIQLRFWFWQAVRRPPKHRPTRICKFDDPRKPLVDTSDYPKASINREYIVNIGTTIPSHDPRGQGGSLGFNPQEPLHVTTFDSKTYLDKREQRVTV